MSSVRPSFEEISLRMAGLISERSTCARLHVGCILTSSDFRQLAWGYNGSGSGLDNACDRSEPGNCGCIHAEQNCLINNMLPRNIDKFLFLTHSPCVTCAKLILNAGGIKSVFYAKEYRDTSGVDLLRKNNVECVNLIITES